MTIFFYRFRLPLEYTRVPPAGAMYALPPRLDDPRIRTCPYSELITRANLDTDRARDDFPRRDDGVALSSGMFPPAPVLPAIQNAVANGISFTT